MKRAMAHRSGTAFSWCHLLPPERLSWWQLKRGARWGAGRAAGSRGSKVKIVGWGGLGYKCMDYYEW